MVPTGSLTCLHELTTGTYSVHHLMICFLLQYILLLFSHTWEWNKTIIFKVTALATCFRILITSRPSVPFFLRTIYYRLLSYLRDSKDKYLILVHCCFLLSKHLLFQWLINAIGVRVKASIGRCRSKRSAGGRQGGHSGLYIGSVAAWCQFWPYGCDKA